LEIAGELGTVGEGEAKSLRDRLIENDLDAYSIRKLGDSKLMSERLATIEADAFRAVRQGDFEGALNLLYGKEYHRFKSRIMKPIISVQERIEANGKRRLENYEKKYRKTRTIIIALTLTSIIFGLLAGFYSKDSLNISSEQSA
jgi:methyl-accepting chemotaxis protein